LHQLLSIFVDTDSVFRGQLWCWCGKEHACARAVSAVSAVSAVRAVRAVSVGAAAAAAAAAAAVGEVAGVLT